MTKQEQIEIVRKTAQSLKGTLTGDWLTESIDQAASALDSDINPAMWVDGIEMAVAMKTSAALWEIHTSSAIKEADLTKRENRLAIKEADLDRRTEHFHDAINQASSKLNYLAEQL